VVSRSDPFEETHKLQHQFMQSYTVHYYSYNGVSRSVAPLSPSTHKFPNTDLGIIIPMT